MNKTIFVLVNLVGIWTFSVVGWGEDGHKMIAQIAADLLNPTASGIVSQYIGSKTLSDIAPLPDDYAHTAAGAWSEPCHYVNMPRDGTNFTMADCPGFCVVKSIFNYTNLLSQQQANPTPCDVEDDDAEPCPLEFLVHYVGDSHQPLHVGYAYDEGGNNVSITFYGEAMNLHHCWDTGMIDHWQSDWQNGATILEDMIGNNTDLVKEYESMMNPIDWADESFHYVLNTVYNFTDNGDFKLNHNKFLGGNRKAINIVDKKQTIPALGQKYYDVNILIIQQRLIAAGIRLGNLLNSILTGV